MPLLQTVLLVYAAAIGTLLALLVLVMTVQQITNWWTRRDRPRRDEQEGIAQPEALGRPVRRSAEVDADQGTDR